jgi:hypothetical protein
LGTWRDAVARLAEGEQETFPVRLAPTFTVDKSLYGSPTFPRSGQPLINSEYGEGFTSLERAWHLRWETQELRRHDRFAGYVYTEFADVEHEAAGLLAHDRRRKDWGGCMPSYVNADTTLVINLVPRVAGADIASPVEAFRLGVHVSHHGRGVVDGRVRAGWVAAGSRVDGPFAEAALSEVVSVQPFVLSGVVELDVPPVAGPARLLLEFVDVSGHAIARSFIDAAPVESANRRGARDGEYGGWRQPGFSEG